MMVTVRNEEKHASMYNDQTPKPRAKSHPNNKKVQAKRQVLHDLGDPIFLDLAEDNC